MAPDLSLNEGNRVRFMKLLFQLKFIHCAMDFLVIFHYFSCSFLSINYVQKSRKVLIEVLSFQLITSHKQPFLNT